MKINFDISDFIKNRGDRVNFLLTFYPQTRNNYAALLAYYWRIFDKVNIPDDALYQIDNGVTSPESISRTKRRIVELSNSDIISQLNDLVNDDFETSTSFLNKIEDSEYKDRISDSEYIDNITTTISTSSDDYIMDYSSIIDGID